VLPIAAATLLAALPATSAAAPGPTRAGTPDRTDCAGSPAGSWTVTVRFDGQEHTSTVQFTPGGKAFIPYGGAGSWERTGGGTFVFRLSEPMWDENGAYAGRVAVRQRAALCADTFTSSGSTQVFDRDDKFIRTVPTEDTGRRAGLSAHP
jgi:hypothetical protein